MSTRVQKGTIVFRPVTRARNRTVESSVPQESLAPRPPPEVHKTSPSISPADAVPSPSTVPPQFSLQGSMDLGDPAAIADTIKQGVPIVISSRVSSQAIEYRPPPTSETTIASTELSHVDVPITDHAPGKRGLRSESLVTTSPKTSRKARRPATPVFDAGACPGEDLDPTSVTMAALCEDTGQGRISSKAVQIVDNHLAWKKSNKEKRTKMRTLMEARKYGRKEESDTPQARPPAVEPEQISTDDATSGPPCVQPTSGNPSAIGDSSGQGFDYSQKVTTSRYNVQVRIGPSGETIVDEESLFVDRNAEEDTMEYTHVEESDVTKFVNSATYSKRFRGSRWSAEETELFYDALSQFGENYELISYILPGRDRKACKNKFKIEDRKNSQRINHCLNNRKPYDMQTLARMTGKDFSGPIPEIRAPMTLSLAESRNKPEANQLPAVGQTTGLSSTATEYVEEVVGEISSFDPE